MIDAKTNELIKELKTRGCFVYVIQPEDLRGLELETGTVALSDKEAFDLMEAYRPRLEDLMWERPFEILEDGLRRFRDSRS